MEPVLALHSLTKRVSYIALDQLRWRCLEAITASQTANTNASVRALLPEPIRTSAALCPDAATLARSE